MPPPLDILLVNEDVLGTIKIVLVKVTSRRPSCAMVKVRTYKNVQILVGVEIEMRINAETILQRKALPLNIRLKIKIKTKSHIKDLTGLYLDKKTEVPVIELPDVLPH